MDIIKALKKNNLFGVFSDAELAVVSKTANVITKKKGETIIQEGESGYAYYIVAEGQVEVLKKEDRSSQTYAITKLNAGEGFGELVFIGQNIRTTTIRAMKNVKLFEFSEKALKNIDQAVFFRRIAQIIKDRLVENNDAVVESLHEKIKLQEHRNKMGRFLIFTIVGLSLYAFILNAMEQYAQYLFNAGFLTIIMMVLFSSCMMIVMVKNKYPLREYGFTMHGWGNSVVEGVLFSIPILLLMCLIKWVVITYVSGYASLTLFSFTAQHKTEISMMAPELFIIVLALLYAVSAIGQELIIRGFLQSSLQIFLSGRQRVFWSVICSNLMFSAFHLYASMALSIVVFLPGLFWGWLYARHKTLVGVVVSHILVGFTALFALGFQQFLL